MKDVIPCKSTESDRIDSIVWMHEKEEVVNERLGLVDRAYLFNGDKEFVVKIYKPDIRDSRTPASPVYILGVCRYGHDSGAVLTKDGKLVGAIEEERLNRDKHTRAYFPAESVRYLLKNHAISWDDITHVAFTFDYNYFRHTSNSESPRDAFFRKIGWVGPSKGEYDTDRLEQFLKDFAKSLGSNYVPPVTFVKHHKCHAVSGLRTCPFGDKPTLIFCIDGRGEDDCTTIWKSENGQLTKLTGTLHPHSLGQIYEYTTVYLGYKRFDEGKVMGLAPYGDPTYLTVARPDFATKVPSLNDQAPGNIYISRQCALEQKRVDKLRKIIDKLLLFQPETGLFCVNLEDMDFKHYQLDKPGYSKRFRKKIQTLVPPLAAGNGGSLLDPNKIEHRPYFNFAFVIQEKIEQIILAIVKHHMEAQKIEHVILSGGLALNITTNKKIIREGIVNPDKFYVPAFPGDDGTPIGAALSVAEEEYGLNTMNPIANVSFGKTYSSREIEQTLHDFGIVPPYTAENKQRYSRQQLIEKTADRLLQNKTVAWFQGGCELGPRALGNRSLLHLLTDRDGNRKVNQIKGREWWRPSALSITEENAGEYFYSIAKAPFMTIGFDIKPEKTGVIAAGKHPFAGDARPQTCAKAEMPLYYELLEEIGRRTGVPGLLNTSFNRQEPIVETPEEAINTFYYSKGIDCLILGDTIIEREDVLQPSILSITEEPALNKHFRAIIVDESYTKETIHTACKAFWETWEGFEKEQKGGFRHFIKFWVAGTNGKYLHVPLTKEIFNRNHTKAMIEAILWRCADEFGSANDKPIELILDCTAANYQRVLVSLFRQHMAANELFVLSDFRPFSSCFVNLTTEVFSDAIWAPIGLYNIIGYLKYAFPSVQTNLFDMQTMQPVEQSDCPRIIAQERPKLIGISVPPGTRKHLNQLMMDLKNKIDDCDDAAEKPLIVFGKNLPTFHTESLLRQYPKAFCVIGEGELAIHDIVEYVGGIREKQDIRNIAYVENDKSSGKIVYSRRERICNLSEFLHPDYSKTNTIVKKGGNISIEYGRGCPWGKCTFCSVHRFWGEPHRLWLHRPIADVIADIRYLYEQGVRKFNFSDEEVVGSTRMDMERLIDFSRLLKRENLEGLEMQFNVRADAVAVNDPALKKLIDRELDEMFSCGFKTAFLGIESGSKTQLRRFGKGVLPETSIEAFETLKKHGFKIQSGFIMFDPLVTKRELRENAMFIEKSGIFSTLSAPLNEIRIYMGTPYAQMIFAWEKQHQDVLLGPPDDDLMVYQVKKYADPEAEIIYNLCIQQYFNGHYEFFYHLKQVTNFNYCNLNTTFLSTWLYRFKQLDIELLLELTSLSRENLLDGAGVEILNTTRLKRQALIEGLVLDIHAKELEKELNTLLRKTKTVLKSGKVA